jgi:hypothetical protein
MLLGPTRWQAEDTSVNRRVVGSSPTCGAIFSFPYPLSYPHSEARNLSITNRD